MTVSTTNNKKVYAGLATQDTFAYDFRVDDADDMEVYFDGVLQAAGDYTVQDVGEDAGGDVVLDTPLASDTTVTLLRNVALTQSVDYQPLDPFPADTHEGALDRLTFLCQQLEEKFERTLTLPLSADTSVDPELPDPVANSVIVWNDDADAWETEVFASYGGLGIDDDATDTRLLLTDSAMVLGTDGSEFVVRHGDSNGEQRLVVGGGSASSSGALIQLYGENHATLASDMKFRAGSNSWMEWDESVGDFEISTGIGAKTVAFTVNASQITDFAANEIHTDGVQIRGTNNIGTEADILFLGNGLMSAQQNWYFTIDSLDSLSGAFFRFETDTETSTGGKRIAQMGETAFSIGPDDTSNYPFYRTADEGGMIISGGDGTNSGASMVLYGGAHASQAADFLFRADAQVFIRWDESVGDIEFSTGVGAKTSALTIDSSQDATFAGDIAANNFDVQTVVKQADEDVTSSTTLQDDDELTLSVEADTVYKVELYLSLFSSSSTPNFHMKLTGPSGNIGYGLDGSVVPTGSGGTAAWVTTSGSFGYSEDDSGAHSSSNLLEVTLDSNTSTFRLVLTGWFINGANAGDLKLQWAQQVSNATAVTVEEGSVLRLTKLGTI